MPEPTGILGGARPNKYGGNRNMFGGGSQSRGGGHSGGGMGGAFGKIENDLKILGQNIQKAHSYLDLGRQDPEARGLYDKLKDMKPKMSSLVRKLDGAGNNYLLGLAERTTQELNSFIRDLNGGQRGGGGGFGNDQGFGNFGFDEPKSGGNSGFGGNSAFENPSGGNSGFGNSPFENPSGGNQTDIWGNSQAQRQPIKQPQPQQEEEDLLGGFLAEEPVKPPQQPKTFEGDNLLGLDTTQTPQTSNNTPKIDIDFTAQQAPNQNPLQMQPQVGFNPAQANPFVVGMPAMNPMVVQQMMLQQQMLLQQQQMMRQQASNPFGSKVNEKNISYNAPQYSQNTSSNPNNKPNDPFANLNDFMK